MTLTSPVPTFNANSFRPSTDVPIVSSSTKLETVLQVDLSHLLNCRTDKFEQVQFYFPLNKSPLISYAYVGGFSTLF